jgi:hypothetical protein
LHCLEIKRDELFESTRKLIQCCYYGGVDDKCMDAMGRTSYNMFLVHHFMTKIESYNMVSIVLNDQILCLVKFNFIGILKNTKRQGEVIAL